MEVSFLIFLLNEDSICCWQYEWITYWIFFRNCILNFSLNAHKRKLEPIFFLFMSANFLQSQKKNNIELGLWIYIQHMSEIQVLRSKKVSRHVT